MLPFSRGSSGEASVQCSAWINNTTFPPGGSAAIKRSSGSLSALFVQTSLHDEMKFPPESGDSLVLCVRRVLARCCHWRTTNTKACFNQQSWAWSKLLSFSPRRLRILTLLSNTKLSWWWSCFLYCYYYIASGRHESSGMESFTSAAAALWKNPVHYCIKVISELNWPWDSNGVKAYYCYGGG